MPLNRSTSPPPPPPHLKRLASNRGLVRGPIGQAENFGDLVDVVTADAVANAKAAALQVSRCLFFCPPVLLIETPALQIQSCP